VDELLTAASAAMGTTLAPLEELGSGERSAVMRCRVPHGGTVVVKSFPASDLGRQNFAAETAGLALAGEAGVAPRILAASQHSLLVVMTDLGAGPSLADLLLGNDAAAAQTGLLAWSRGCGELALAAAGREAEFTSSGWLERRLGEIPGLLATLSIPAPAGLDDDLADVASVLRPGLCPVFSPGDICPDNNVLTRDGARFVDFESAEFHAAFLDAAYLRMPFSTCWCAFRLPDRLGRRAEAEYRDLVSQIHPDLADDRVWLPGVRRAVAAWTLHAMTYLLDRAIKADKSMIYDDRVAPTRRQLLRYRWQRLLTELEAGSEDDPASAGPQLPALRALAAWLLASTERWQVPDLPVYPAFLASSGNS